MSFSTAQISNARSIAAVARKRGLGDQGVMVGLITTFAEAACLNYANDGTSGQLGHFDDGQHRQLNAAERAVAQQSLALAHDAVGRDLDSMGLFQQRPSAGWGPPVDLMNPTISAGKFYDVLVKFDWKSMADFKAAQKVQGSNDPTGGIYLQQRDRAADMLAALGPASVGRISLARTLQVAQSTLGYNGRGTVDSPDSKFGDWMGFNPAQWCASWVSWVLANAGTDIPDSPIAGSEYDRGFAYCPAGVNYFKKQGTYHEGTDFTGIKAGDVGFQDFGLGRASHTWIAEKDHDPALGGCWTIQGNTTDSTIGRTGNCVRRKFVPAHDAAHNVGYGRPAYGPDIKIMMKMEDWFDMATEAQLEQAVGNWFTRPRLIGHPPNQRNISPLDQILEREIQTVQLLNQVAQQVKTINQNLAH